MVSSMGIVGKIIETTVKLQKTINIHLKEKQLDNLIKREKGKKKEVSIADILLCDTGIGNVLKRCDFACRYLAIKDYNDGNERGFELYEKMQNARIGDGYSKEAVAKFKELIQSYKRNGYDKNSFIILDKNLTIIDGSHRIAMALYYNYSNITALILNKEVNVNYSFDWFMKNNFSYDEVKLINKTGNELRRNILTPFSCIVWAPAVEFYAEITKDLSMFGDVLSVKKTVYSSEEYKNVVKTIYAIDDIESWKIDKKLEYMAKYKSELISIDLLIDNPDYRIKTKTGLPLSRVGEYVKAAIREKYAKRINDYYFDIILHIGDNLYQSCYMRDVINNNMNFIEKIDILENKKL